MAFLLPLAIGVLFSTGLYLLMSFHLLRMIFGFLLLSQAVNLFLFSVGGLTYGESPLIAFAETQHLQSPEPLSQALILTAIVIGFAATSFLVVLLRQSASILKTGNTDELREAEL